MRWTANSSGTFGAEIRARPAYGVEYTIARMSTLKRSFTAIRGRRTVHPAWLGVPGRPSRSPIRGRTCQQFFAAIRQSPQRVSRTPSRATGWRFAAPTTAGATARSTRSRPRTSASCAGCGTFRPAKAASTRRRQSSTTASCSSPRRTTR